jgi:O-antigen/teichoic acid export membrane protein
MLVELPHLRGREAVARAFGTGLAVAGTAALLALAVIPWALGRAGAWPALAEVSPHAAAVALFAAALAAREIAQIVPQLHRQTRFLAVLAVAIEYGSAVLGLALVALGFGAAGLLWGTGIVMAAGAAAGVRRSLAVTGRAPGWDRAFLLRALSIGLPMLVITTAYTMVQSADRFFLAYHRGAAEVGIYSIGYTVASGVLALAATVNLVFLPVAVKLLQDAPARLVTFIEESMRFLLLALGLCVAGAFLVGAPVVRALAGSSYAPAGELLPYMVIGYSLFTVGQLLQWIPMAVTRQVRGVVASHLAVAALNVGLAAALVPRHGMAGAALASVASYAAGVVLMGLVARGAVPGLRFRSTLRALALAVTVALACRAARLPAEASVVAAVVAAGALVAAYAAAGLAVGAVRRRDLDLIRSMARGAAPQ